MDHAPATAKSKKLANLVEREPQLPRAPNEHQALRVFLGIKPVSAGATRWIGQDTNAFVVTDGLDVHLGSLGQGTDGQSRICVHAWLISVVTPGSEPSDQLYSMLDQFAFAGTAGTSVPQQLTPMRARGVQC